jgi:hypothetical protein
MKKFITILVLAIVASTSNIYAQFAADALRFSQGNYGSSARFKGLGGAQISLGGDISSLGANPAGLGMFTKSEFSVTPEFDNTKSEATYLGQRTNSTKNQLNLNNIGAVWYNPVLKAKGSDLDKGLISVVFGLGYNRTNDFRASVNFGGVNANNSIADSFAQLANGYTADGLASVNDVTNMAYQNFLIDQIAAGSTTYEPATSLNNTQSQSIIRTGSTSEMNFSGALNFSNKFYLGASIGIVDLRYVSNSEFVESGTNISTSPENEQAGKNYDLSYRVSQITNGSGINAKLGLIFKPVNTLRIGATFQSPTWMRVEDNYSEVLDTRYTLGGSVTNLNNDYYDVPFDYNLRTPYKGSVGASVIIGNNALLSADVDYVDYASMKISPTGNNSTSSEITNSNADIKSNYNGAFNYRVGGEYKLGQLALRAGFALNGSPYKVDPDNQFDTKYYSGGLGYRFSQYYIDLAYQRVETNQTFNPYPTSIDATGANDPMATVKQNRNNVFLTVGVKF